MPLILHVLGKNVENSCIYRTFLSPVIVMILKVALFGVGETSLHMFAMVTQKRMYILVMLK